MIRRSIATIATLLSMAMVLPGCQEKTPPWVDKLTEELHAAKAEKSAAKKAEAIRANLGEDITEDVLRQKLEELSASGFEVSEYAHDSARSWPNGPRKAYLDEATRRNMAQHIPSHMVLFVARRSLTKMFPPVERTVAISFLLDTEQKRAKPKADVWFNLI